MLVWLFLLTLLAAVGPPLDVRPEVGVRCPRQVDVEAALRARLPSGQGPAWSMTYTETTGRLSVVLRAPDGQVRLTRTLDVAGSCGESAEALAVIVARYFEDLGWSAPPAPLPPEPAPRLMIAAGPAAWAHAGWRLRGEIDGRLRVAGPVWLGIAALLPEISRSETLGPGRAAADAWGVRASALLSLPESSRLRLGGGPDALFTFETARSQGIAVPATETRVGVGVGLGTHVGFVVSPRWQGRLDLAMHRTFGPEFSVRGVGGRRVLALPAWQAVVAVKMAAILW